MTPNIYARGTSGTKRSGPICNFETALADPVTPGPGGTPEGGYPTRTRANLSLARHSSCPAASGEP